MNENKVNIEIDGKKIVAEQGSMIIEAADNHGVYIPRFCYHKKLSVAANCRMCLIELEGGRKAIPACATPISEGMKIKTRSELARKSQKAVMEFLLINHPLDCPICDQGGQCELQDLAMGFGADRSEYDSTKNVVKDKDLGPLISTEMTRCINCTRCVRFTQEIAGDQELGVMGRGEHAEIGTYIERAVQSELSGNVIDICPVGALTSKPFRFSARAWELEQRPSIAAHDCLGSNINVHVIHDEVKRVVPRENESINEVWLSDRDRFSYAGVNHAERITQPMLKKDGKWQIIDWTTAFEIIASSFENVKNAYGADSIAGLVSPSSTLEEQYLLQKLLRGFGSNNIDHRLQLSDFRDQASLPVFPNLGVAINDLETVDAALLIGSDIQREQPLAAARLLKAKNDGGTIMVANPIDFDFHFTPRLKLIAKLDQLANELAAVTKALAGNAIPAELTALLQNVTVDANAQAIADKLASANQVAIMLGAIARNAPNASSLRFWARWLAKLSNASFGELTQGANGAGAWLAGAVPHRGVAATPITVPGVTAQEMFTSPQKAYLLYNVEPEFDHADANAAVAALQNADFVACCAPFMSEAMREYADVVLPIAPFTEMAGTFVNCNGQWQSFKAANKPLGEARPGWKVLRVLGNFLDLPQFEYLTVEDVTAEVKQAVDAMNADITNQFTPTVANHAGLQRVGLWPIYRTDNVVRRSQPLQEMLSAPVATLHPEQAAELQLTEQQMILVSQGENEIELPVQFDVRVAKGCVMVPAALPTTQALGNAYGEITIRSVA